MERNQVRQWNGSGASLVAQPRLKHTQLTGLGRPQAISGHHCHQPGSHSSYGMWTLTLVGCAAWNVGLKPATGDTLFGISGERVWVGGVTARGGVAPGDWRSIGAVNVRPESSVVWAGPRDVEWVGPRDVEWVGLADCGTTVENYLISYEPTEQSASTPNCSM